MPSMSALRRIAAGFGSNSDGEALRMVECSVSAPKTAFQAGVMAKAPWYSKRWLLPVDRKVTSVTAWSGLKNWRSVRV